MTSGTAREFLPFLAANFFHSNPARNFVRVALYCLRVVIVGWILNWEEKRHLRRRAGSRTSSVVCQTEEELECFALKDTWIQTDD